MNFLKLSCKILQNRGFIGKNLGKILTKKSRTIQDSYQEFQEFLHRVIIVAVVAIESVGVRRECRRVHELQRLFFRVEPSVSTQTREKSAFLLK